MSIKKFTEFKLKNTGNINKQSLLEKMKMNIKILVQFKSVHFIYTSENGDLEY